LYGGTPRHSSVGPEQLICNSSLTSYASFHSFAAKISQTVENHGENLSKKRFVFRIGSANRAALFPLERAQSHLKACVQRLSGKTLVLLWAQAVDRNFTPFKKGGGLYFSD
jgi:hypothetical protein